MIGIIAVAVVGVFTVVFGSFALRQELEDRQRDRETITLIVRQANRFCAMYPAPAEMPWDHKDTLYSERGVVYAQPEWRGHRGSGEKRRQTPSQPSRGNRAA